MVGTITRQAAWAVEHRVMNVNPEQGSKQHSSVTSGSVSASRFLPCAPGVASLDGRLQPMS